MSGVKTLGGRVFRPRFSFARAPCSCSCATAPSFVFFFFFIFELSSDVPFILGVGTEEKSSDGTPDGDEGKGFDGEGFLDAGACVLSVGNLKVEQVKLSFYPLMRLLWRVCKL